MEAIIEFVKTNLPLIAVIFAFVVAAIIILAVVVTGVKKRKRADGDAPNEAEKSARDVVADDETSVNDGETSSESVETDTEPSDGAAEIENSPTVSAAEVENPPIGTAEKIAATDFTVMSAPKAQAEKQRESEELSDKTNETVENTEDKNMAKAKETAAAKTEPSTKKTAAKPAAQAKKTEVKAVKNEGAAKKTATAVKTETKAESAKKSAPEPKKITGKWIIKEKGEGEFVAFLYANNGELILTSEIYASEESARTGIETIKKNIGGDFQIYKDKNRNYYFKVKSVKNRILCVGETYKTRDLCEKAAESVKRFAESPVQDGVEKDITVIKYVLPKKEAKVDERSAYSGKWVIEKDDDTYMAKLFASNGELLLNSESYVSYASAKSAVETIKTNGIAGNFIIDSDKRGRYFFKLRNAQKTTLCIGETYAQLSACQSAIESVRRFLKTAKLTEN